MMRPPRAPGRSRRRNQRLPERLRPRLLPIGDSGFQSRCQRSRAAACSGVSVSERRGVVRLDICRSFVPRPAFPPRSVHEPLAVCVRGKTRARAMSRNLLIPYAAHRWRRPSADSADPIRRATGLTSSTSAAPSASVTRRSPVGLSRSQDLREQTARLPDFAAWKSDTACCVRPFARRHDPFYVGKRSRSRLFRQR